MRWLALVTAFAVTVVLALLGLRDAKQRLARAGGPGEALLAESIEVAMYGFLVTSLFLNDNIYQRWLWLLIALAIIARQLAMKATVASAVVDRPAADPVRA